MKKILFLSVILIYMSYDINAQDNKASIGIGIGGASAGAKGEDGVKDNGFGFNFYLNGMYNINENISAGIEYNSNIAVIGSIDATTLDLKATQLNGFLLKGRYSVGSGTTRPFGGLMMGMYRIKPGDVTVNGTSIAFAFEPKTVFGFAPEIGVVFNNFQLATSYHFLGKYKGTAPDGNGGTTDISEIYTLWQFNIGLNLGIISN
jgi:hypothetical protein